MLDNQQSIPCSRVFTTSKGCRAKTEAKPAVVPATACFLQAAFESAAAVNLTQLFSLG